ncbi:MAG TPA: isoleucine--tRNA ligase [Candidatus Krumholzibacteria bacterium]|nr:isoleucine--tRNA ligase [Candidatus Krumholzibacteria bacterium]
MSQTRFPRLPSSDHVASAEEAISAYWERETIFRRSVEERPATDTYVFYEGPPTANGKPGVHHVIARLCKDLACRYQTMRGHRVVRKAGWDTHGLPVEIEVERSLGINRKEQIEAYGIAEFNRQCRESVFKYEKDWVAFTRRIAFWVDMEHPYVTYDNRYIESVWWILKEFWKEKLIYQGHKSVPFCPRCQTSLSSHEVSLGYKDVADPSVFVKFKRRGVDEFFLAWTTTPWTLTCNAALAVAEKETYARVAHNGEVLILAEALLGALEGEYEVRETFRGAELVGATYEPLFDYYKDTEGAFRVIAGDFVSLDDGTGIVHIAPAFGADDFRMHQEQGIPLIQGVLPDGTFDAAVTDWAGQFIKDADPAIVKWLKQHGKLYKSGRITHSYPFCWRCSTPLMYYARQSWYIRTTSYKDRMIEANRNVNWIPKEVGEARFGNWLENNVDWSLSRERYWGTPLNIWVCEVCGDKDAVGSIDELRERASNFPQDAATLDLHRPFVDNIELTCACGGVMRRVKDVIDVWFDSGAMPFAQYHYPWDESGMFESQFPADFISEGIDQSRGWFYSLLAISVFLKGRSPYKNCLTTELILDKHGQKMSKSKGNAVEPWEVLNDDGADALRWYLATTSPPWTPTRFDRDGVKDTARKMMENLRNVYAFFSMYASIDGYRAGDGPGEPTLLDRWILSRYNTTVKRVTGWLDEYDLTRAARAIERFVLDELSNWYVRRSRRRFWKGEMGPDKLAAYHTLYTVLEGLTRMLAPFVPYLAEELFLALHGRTAADGGGESVHLQRFPEFDARAIDDALESTMDAALAVASLGRTVRNEAGMRVRQPLSEVLVHSNDAAGLDRLVADPGISGLVLEELNVRAIRRLDDLGGVATLSATPVFPVLGRKFGKQVPRIAAAIKGAPAADLARFLKTGALALDVDGERVDITREDAGVQVTAAEGYGASEDRGLTVVLNLVLDEELRLEGAARELINRLQNLRKGSGLDVTDRIRIRYTGGEWTTRVVTTMTALIASETLADGIAQGAVDWESTVAFELDGEAVSLWIQKYR